MTEKQAPIEAFFNEIVFGFIYSDIQAAIAGKANYLSALGLVAYTEFIGGLITGTLGSTKPGESRKRFYTFWNRMGPNYETATSKGNHALVKIYSEVRSGLVHSYFISKDSVIRMKPGDGYGEKCGVEALEPGGKVVFVVEKYFADFKVACDAYYKELVGGTDPTLLQNFERAVGSKWYVGPLAGKEETA